MKISLERYLVLLGGLLWCLGIGLVLAIDSSAAPQLAATGIGTFFALGIWLHSYREVLDGASWKRAQLYSFDAEALELLPSLASVVLAGVAVYFAGCSLSLLLKAILGLFTESSHWWQLWLFVKAGGAILIAVYAAIGMVLSSIIFFFPFRLMLVGSGVLLPGFIFGWDVVAIGAILLGGTVAGAGFWGRCLSTNSNAVVTN